MMNDYSTKYGAELDQTVTQMIARGKGLLAADESTGTIGKRFQGINVENVESNRQAYRQLLFDVSNKAQKYISGVILYEETLFQKTRDGTDFVKLLQQNGIVPGIKVDKGTVVIPGSLDNEPVTAGIDGLTERVQKYYQQGARFAKWRAVIEIKKNAPSDLAIKQNADLLARYAAICLQNGLVPIVEPEVLVMEGNHDIDVSFDVTVRTLSEVFKALIANGVALERIILKPNFVLPGTDSGKKVDNKTIADYTLRALKRTVPPAVRGIMFLSGGMSEDMSAEVLSLLNKQKGNNAPWALSFSYGRALQASALKAWSGKPEQVAAGQEQYLKKAENCYKAALGEL